MADKGHQSKEKRSSQIRSVILLVIALVFLYVLVPQIKGLRSSFKYLEHANLINVSEAVLVTIVTFFVAALMYHILGKYKLKYRNTLLVQTASGFANRLLPAGLGGMGLMAQYLRSQKYRTSEAVMVAGLNNTTGLVGHFTLFTLILVFGKVSADNLRLPKLSSASLIVVLIIILIIVFLVTYKHIGEKAINFLKQILEDLKSYKGRYFKLVLALLDSILLTILYVSILFICTRALGANLTFGKTLVVFTAGSLIGNFTPTPGGIIGIEAGLFAGFVSYGISSDISLAIALLYRFITYWLPIIPGIIAFSYAQKKLKLI